MSTERDELAGVIIEHPWLDHTYFGGSWPAGFCPSCKAVIPAGHNSPSHATHIADAILAAGYTKPRQVTTVEDLEGMASGVVIRDADGDICKHRGDGYWDSMAEPEEAFHYGDFDGVLPATVLYSPVVAP